MALHSFSLIALLLWARTCLAANLDDWKAKSIYQVVTDRFALPSDNGAPCDTAMRRYCGGSWEGVIQKLDYIQGMGFDAVWISPVVSNVEGQSAYGEAYHGYWPQDLNTVNKHFGSSDDLKRLSSALHARGMYLMVDIVVNHMGPNTSAAQDFTSSSAFASYQPAPLSSASSYHNFHFVSGTSYSSTTPNQTDIEQGWLGDTSAPLPDVNTENPEVVTLMNTWIKNLVTEYGVDGLRIDTAKHVRKDFWPDFVASAGVFSMGEVLSDDVGYASPYTSVMDSILDYPTYFALFSAFSSGAGKGNLSALAAATSASQREYKHGAVALGSFLENQDQPRLQSKTQDMALVMNAIAWTFVNDGIPIVYYGQEQGYTGSNDPDNREALWLSGYTTDKPLVKHITSLNRARKAAMSANKDFLTTPVTFITPNTNMLAVSKPPLLTLLTNAGSSTQEVSWTLPGNAFAGGDGSDLIDALTCAKVNVVKTSSGGFSIRAKAGMPQVWSFD
ncbi:hypothetical protein HGRIS_014811 [Hohenbuehelia grisea]|uniref:alpha-amylase n=1 Tax=Hohenbuehelia grisea TaxID=104357 RepID=A0ABR3IQX6_9AGAR